MATSRVRSFEGTGDVAAALQGLLEAGDVVLVKASRAAGLEAVVGRSLPSPRSRLDGEPSTAILSQDFPHFKPVP